MIDISLLTEADRGRIVVYTEEATGAKQDVVLVNWNEKFVFVARPDICPVYGGHCDPDFLSFDDGSISTLATLAYRYGLQHRPAQIGAQPRGFIPDGSLLRPPNAPDHANPATRFGVMDYPEKLSDEDVYSYELNYIATVWRSPR